MAIKPKEPKTASILTFPEPMESKVCGIFTMQQISSISKGLFDDGKKELETYLQENTDGIDIKTSEGVPTNYGLITYKSMSADKVDTDALVQLVKDGVITIESLVALATFSTTKLKESLPKSSLDKVIIPNDPKLYLEFRANSDFKAKCLDAFSPLLEATVEQSVEAPAQAAPVVAPVEKKHKKEAAEKARAIVAKSKKTSAHDELSKILGK